MPTVTSANKDEFDRQEMAKRNPQMRNENNSYTVKKTTIKKGLIGSKNPTSKDFYDVEHKTEGHYARLKEEPHAHIVAYGLNKQYPEHTLGGFSDETAKKIRSEMIAENHPMSKHPNFHS